MPLRLPRPRYLVPLIVACGLFMENMDATVIATALPAIAKSFGEDPLRLSLAITTYLLSLGVFLPLSGWLADRFGARSVFASAIAVFTTGSIACALSGSLVELVLARALQGIGGAMMVPVGRLVVLRTTPKSELVAAMAYLTVPALLGPVIGPPLGGFIATYYSWHWIFLINLPIGLLGLVLTFLLIPNIREPWRDSLDLKGFALSGVGLAATMLGFENLGRGVLPSRVVATLIGVGCLLLALFWRHARRTPVPILDLSLFRLSTFRASVLGGFAFRAGIGALPFLLPLLLQAGFGFTPFESGLTTCAAAAGAMLMKITAPQILRRNGFRRVLVVNTVICTAFMAANGLFRPSTPHAVMLAVLLTGGFFRSLQFTSLNTLAYAEVAAPAMSRATTLASVGQQLSLTFGVGFGALMLHLTLAFTGQGALGADSFWPAFLGIAVVSMTALFFILPLRRDAGAEVSGWESAPPPSGAQAIRPAE
jgi:EmrB/QacA subfamily drug resistance transporter